jgi:fumarate reductase (CoM/CoB) subunit B
MEKGKVSILRYNPELDSKPHYEVYEFPFERGMSVLDVAFYIYENLDGTFSFSYCCRNSHCGLCGAIINGKAGLMCRESATPEMTLEPLRNLTVIRDLIVDRQEFEGHKDSLRLFLDRVSVPEREPEKISLKDLDRFKVASRCVECYSCISGCPAVRENRHVFLGPAGLVQLARHAFDPRDELNREVTAYSAGLYNCTQCGQCTEVCPHEIAPAEYIEMLRAQMVEKGRVPRVLNELIALIRNTDKAITRPKGRKPFLEQDRIMGNSRVGLFVGCNIDYDFRLMPIATSAVKVLQRLDVNLAIPAEQVCCGTPLKEVGFLEEIKGLVVKNVEAFRKAGCTKVLTLCSGCGLGLKKLWPEVYRNATGQEVPFVVEDFTEFLASLPWTKGGLKGLKLRVTYHDACSLRRGQGVHDEPRQLLRAIPELKFMEMAESDYCCGGGGGLRMTNLEMAKRILNRKLSFLKDLEVEAIVTGCPTCIKQLTMGLSQQQGRKVAVLHPAVVVAKAMGIE